MPRSPRLLRRRPAPPLGRSNEPFPSGDHPFLHSGTHLQGRRAQEKYAGGLFYLPGGVTGFGGFTSAVVVDNPDPVFGVNVQIDYFDHTGFPVGSTGPHFIPPEGHHEEAASPLGLIVAELVANAVEHGRGRWVDVELSIDDSAIEIAVSNQGAADLGDPAGWTTPPAHARAGRGLPLVRALVDDVKWAASQGRLSVRARRSVR